MKFIAGKFLLVLNSFLFAQLNFTGSYVSSFGDSQNDFNYFDNRIISALKNNNILPKATKHDMEKEKAYIQSLINI